MTDVNRLIRERYSRVAGAGLSSEQEPVQRVSLSFGYEVDELHRIPPQANLGLSCGHPLRYAKLEPGETFVDLGCGAGIDVFLGAIRVGPSGRAIGIDLTEAMIALARQNAIRFPQDSAPVRFLVASMAQIPLPTESVDCVISNSAINMTADKRAVFEEAIRILKPGGRISFSDLALRPASRTRLVADISLAIGFMPNPITRELYAQLLSEAGFTAVSIFETALDLNVYSEVWSASARKDLPPAKARADQNMRELANNHDLNDYAMSIQVCAQKPILTG